MNSDYAPLSPWWEAIIDEVSAKVQRECVDAGLPAPSREEVRMATEEVLTVLREC